MYIARFSEVVRPGAATLGADFVGDHCFSFQVMLVYSSGWHLLRLWYFCKDLQIPHLSNIKIWLKCGICTSRLTECPQIIWTRMCQQYWHFIPWPRHNSCRKGVCGNVWFLHGCCDVSYRSCDKNNNPRPCGNHTFSNSVHHQNLESPQPMALSLWPRAFQALMMHLIRECMISAQAWVLAIISEMWMLLYQMKKISVDVEIFHVIFTFWFYCHVTV